MNINLNLATRPYIELRSVYARLRVLALMLAVLALPMLLVIHSAETSARLAAARVTQLHDNIALLQQQQTQARQLALQGPNASVLHEAEFLNGMFRLKSFSWTATMSDLETVLPHGVQVVTLQPLLTPDGRITIRMRVVGARVHTVELIRNLERSRHFLAARLVSEGLADQTGTAQNRRISENLGANGPAPSEDVSSDIQAEYRPLPLPQLEPEATPPSGTRVAQLTNPHPQDAAPRSERGRRRLSKPAAGTPLPAGGR